MIEVVPGQQFGYLTALEQVTPSEGLPMWRCKCVCGNERVVSTIALLQGKVSSCGCRHRPISDYTGKRFNHLVGVRPTEKREHQTTVWVWRCDCGREIESRPKYITSGHRKSCGCMAKEVKAQGMKHAMESNPIVDGTNLSLIASKKVNRNNTSGVRGVHWAKQRQKWCAAIGFQGRHIALGCYSNFDDAVKARKEAEEKYYVPMLEKHKDMLKGD